MTTITKIVFVIALILSIFVPFGYYFIGEKNKKRYKKSIASNVFFFFGTLVIATIVTYSGSSTALAAEGATAASSAGLATGLGYIAAALVTGLSCIGGGIAVASAASAALGAISEDPSIFGKSLIFAGLAEGVALYGLIISFMILGKL
ncbi:MAG TPA: ATPase [Candidatus Merdenecus merdavium]|nr:ATPase [Candidatus Merdenecus merdavium]